MPHKRMRLSEMLILVFILSTAAAAQFETRSSSSIIWSPRSLAVADFNHDGSQDIAVAAFSSGRLAVLLGRGDGTFQPATYYDLADTSAEWVATADFNGDGNMDVAVASGDNISVLLGNGNATFQSPVPYATTQMPTFVAIGDFNGDGKPDLIVADGLYVSVLLANGNGTFQPPKDTAVFPPSGLAPLSVGDFNGDGKLDVAVLGGGSLQLGILLGNGDGTFNLVGEYPVGEFSNSIAVGDFNGDQHLDLAVTDGTGNQIYILAGNGDGTFQPATPFFSNGPGSIHAADVNGDGKLDLLFFAGVGSQTDLMIMLGNGDGTFQRPSTFPSFVEPTDLAVADFNGDHKLDVAVADFLGLGFQGDSVDVLLNTGVVSFSPTTPLSFLPQIVGTTSAPQSVTLKNQGKTTLSISSMRIAAPFQLASGTTCGTSVAPGASCTLSVAFAPTVVGFKGGLLSISDSASTKAQVIELSGTGTVITVSPTKLDFGSQKVGTKSAPEKVTVTNVGSTTVSVTGISIAGIDAKDYVEIHSCGSQIAPGGSCTIGVTFHPTAIKKRTATLQVSDNGGASPQQVSLTGTGT